MLKGKRASYLMLFLYFFKNSSWFLGDEKMPLPPSTREHLEHWKIGKTQVLLKKLENVVDFWNLDDAAVPFPFNRPQIFATPALLRMFQFFWRSKFVLLDKYKKPINTFWQIPENQRIARSVHCIQITSDPPMDSATRAESLWFPLVVNTWIMYKNK